jgi:Ca2+-binding RTX toxin-like protein
MNFTGTNGNDDLIGTVDADVFDMTQGGKDRVQGLDGDDTINFGSKFTSADKVDGGVGVNDTLTLSGDYSAGLVMKASTMVSIDRLTVAGGNSYDITIVDANTSGFFTLIAISLGAGESMRFDGSADTDTSFGLNGGSGDDVLIGGAGNDGFVSAGGHDVAFGGAGIDNFAVQGFFGAGDAVDGGDDTDFMALEGDYSGGLTITKEMLQNVEVMQLAASFDFELTFENKVVANGATLVIDSSFVGAGHGVAIDATAARFGTYNFHGTAADDTFLSGDGNDFADVDEGGNDTVETGDGDDEIRFGANFTRDDRADGGNGHDIFRLDGDYSAGIDFRAGTLAGVEEFIMEAGNSYSLTLHDDNVAAGETMLVSAASLAFPNTLTFDGRNETNGSYQVEGGAGDDTIFGGNGGGAGDTVTGADGNDVIKGFRGDDQIFAGAGADTITGGKGADTIDLGDVGDQADVVVLNKVAESTGADRDLVVDFNVDFDRFDLDITVTGFDITVNATLSEASFDADLEAAIGNAQLARDHAVLFAANAGDLNGGLFIVVDANGNSGYQAGKDFVIEVSNLVGTPTNAIFI